MRDATHHPRQGDSPLTSPAKGGVRRTMTAMELRRCALSSRWVDTGTCRAWPRNCTWRSRRSRGRRAARGRARVRAAAAPSTGVELSEAGTAVFERAREGWRARGVRCGLAALRGSWRGPSRSGGLPPRPVDLPGLLAGFHAAHPRYGVLCARGARPRSSPLCGARARRHVHRSRARALDDGLAGEWMVSEELLLITPPGPARRRSTSSPACRHRLRRSSALRDTVKHTLRAAAAMPEIVFERDELVGIHELVARSLGVSMVPRSTRRGRRAAGGGDPDRASAPAHARLARAPPAASGGGVPGLRPRGHRRRAASAGR